MGSRVTFHDTDLFRGVMKNFAYYTLSLSGGKDSLALFLKILEEGQRLDEVVMVDLGDEFPAVYDALLFVASICLKEGIKFTILEIPETKEYQEFKEKEQVECTMFEFLAFGDRKSTRLNSSHTS